MDIVLLLYFRAKELALFSRLWSKSASLLHSSTWKCQAMVGDALKTNDAIFKHERQVLAQQNAQKRLAIRVKCQLHQLCLVRRPLVLSIPRFWTTLVRLGHLFEGYSFKKQLALAVLQVLRAVGGFQRNLVLFHAQLKKTRVEEGSLSSFSGPVLRPTLNLNQSLRVLFSFHTSRFD